MSDVQVTSTRFQENCCLITIRRLCSTLTMEAIIRQIFFFQKLVLEQGFSSPFDDYDCVAVGRRWVLMKRLRCMKSGTMTKLVKCCNHIFLRGDRFLLFVLMLSCCIYSILFLLRNVFYFVLAPRSWNTCSEHGHQGG